MSMNAIQNIIHITDEQKRQFREQGYFILECAIDEPELEMLREECTSSIERIHAEMDRSGSDVAGLNRRNSRYFITLPSAQSARLKAFALSELMAEICRATLGDEAYFAWEQFVVKAAETGQKFSWHQDSAYAHSLGVVSLPPAVSCWCALDDMSEENGTVYLLPYEQGGGGQLVEHVKDEEINDLVGYHGDEPGTPVMVPAGSIAVFSGLAFHRSGFNTTNKMRRVYLAQYSAAIGHLEDGTPLGQPEPFLQNGARVEASGD